MKQVSGLFSALNRAMNVLDWLRVHVVIEIISRKIIPKLLVLEEGGDLLREFEVTIANRMEGT